MPFRKCRRACLVAVHAECRDIVLQQVAGFRRRVGIVAGQTPFADRLMFEFCLLDGIIKVGMTAEAEFIPSFEEIKLVAGGVGIMTLHAISL